MCLLCLFTQGAYSFIIFVKLLLKTQKYLELVLNEELQTVKCNKKQVIYIITHSVVCSFPYVCYKIKVCTTSFGYTIRGAHLGHVVVHFWWGTTKNK
jgi:hypothetical protein